MSQLSNRLQALLTFKRLPPMTVDLGTYRRLEAMRDRLTVEDPTLAQELGGGMEHVVYAAIRGGLRASEERAGVKYDENTGLRRDDEQSV